MLPAMQPWQPQPPTPPQQGWTPQPLPGALPARNAEDHDLAALSPFWPKVAAGLVATTGLCAVLGSLQTWMTVELFDAWMIAPIVDALLGVAAIAVAARLVSARRWAAIASLVLASLLVLATGVWAVYALSVRLFAVFIIVAPVIAVPSAVLAGVSLGACDRADKARERLAAQGLELGL
jgi:hypothetical protein